VNDIQHLFIADNAELEQVNVSALEAVDELQIMNNPSLAPSVFDGMPSLSTEMQGNLEP